MDSMKFFMIFCDGFQIKRLLPSSDNPAAERQHFLKTLNRMVEEEQGYTTGKISLGNTDIKSISKETLRSRNRHGLPAADCFSTQY